LFVEFTWVCRVHVRRPQNQPSREDWTQECKGRRVVEPPKLEDRVFASGNNTKHALFEQKKKETYRLLKNNARFIYFRTEKILKTKCVSFRITVYKLNKWE